MCIWSSIPVHNFKNFKYVPDLKGSSMYDKKKKSPPVLDSEQKTKSDVWILFGWTSLSDMVRGLFFSYKYLLLDSEYIPLNIHVIVQQISRQLSSLSSDLWK